MRQELWCSLGCGSWQHSAIAPCTHRTPIFVDTDGDVGIGDSTPDASLDIERSDPGGAKLLVESTVPGGVPGLVAMELRNNGGHVAFQIDSGVTGLPGGGDAAWDFSVATGGAAIGALGGAILGTLDCGCLTLECADGEAECREKYNEETADCGSRFFGADDYDYNRCMDNAWRNFLFCLNGLPPRIFVP